MADPNFIHLNIHTEYSLVDSIVRVNQLTDMCHDNNMPALAITDMANTFAAVKFYKKCLSKGIKPILGAHIWLHNADDVTKPFKLLIYAQNQEGYSAICELLSLGYMENQHMNKSCVPEEELFKRSKNIIVVNDSQDGPVSVALQNSRVDIAENTLIQYKNVFGDRFYSEIQRVGHPSEVHNAQLVDLTFDHEVPLIATNPVRFLKQEDFDLHEIKVCIRESRLLDDNRRPKNYTEQQYFKSTEEMQELFSDIPTAVSNTVDLAKKCNVYMTLGEVFLPEFEISTGQRIEDYIVDVSNEGLNKRLESIDFNEISKIKNADSGNVDSNIIITRDDYQERLDFELDIINKMGFAGYFLIVSDFIQWSKDNKVPVGPGRGSGAGSLVAFALEITDLDPIEFDLLFERFLNPERISMPDFDVDFCQDGRERVINYVTEKYGRDKVSQIITFGTMAAKAVIRDVGRVLGMGYGFIDQIAKLIPFEPGMTLTKAMDIEPELKQRYKNDAEVTRLLDTGLALEGLVRNVGKHAGGVVIAPSSLTDFTAIYAEQGSTQPVSHYDKDDLEDVGLVKFDFLGLRTLTIIDRAVQHANVQRQNEGLQEIVISELPSYDDAAYELFQCSNTTAVFQLESSGMKELIKRLKPDSFNDLIALVALYRPGPLESGMVDSYVDRKHGREEVDCLHDSIVDILRPTYGVILYQEQVMNIARKMSGYTLGSADILRKAMGKKVPEIMAKQRKVFVDGAVANDIKQQTADYIFSLIEKFAGYGFNKSHSACYALLSYQTAWLKANYPAAFMSANMSADLDNTDKVVKLIADAKEMNLEVLSPNVNQCYYRFYPVSKTEIYYGLGAIKGIGEQIIETVVKEREENGEYANMFDLAARVMKCVDGKINRRVLESFICAGAFDCFNQPRPLMYANVTHALENATQIKKTFEQGQNDLFSMGLESDIPSFPEYRPGPKWSDEEVLKLEKSTLGLYLSGHPIDMYRDEIKQITSNTVASIQESDHPQSICGLIVAVRTLFNKKGHKFAFISIDDGTSRMDVSVFAKVYNETSEMLRQDNIVIIKGEAKMDDRTESIQLKADNIIELVNYRYERLKRIMVHIDGRQLNTEKKQIFKELILQNAEGNARLVIRYINYGASADVNISNSVQPSNALIVKLKELFGENAVSIHY